MKKNDWLWVILPLISVIAIDQITKQIALQMTRDHHHGLLHFALYFNRGAMLGLFSDLSPVLRIVSLSTGGAFLLFCFIFIQILLPTRTLILRAGMSILIGGILGNVIDRSLWGYVVDFIILGNRKLGTGVFNMADLLQWVGYFMIGYTIVKDRELLWPHDNVRQGFWVNWNFQKRYCAILVLCGMGFSLISGVFSYTFLRFVVIDLIGNNQRLLSQFLYPWMITYATVCVAFTMFLFILGKHLSHRTAGPIFAFERFLTGYMIGEKVPLHLRKGDEFLHLQELASRVTVELRPSEKNNMTPLLPRGQANPILEKALPLVS